MIGFFRLYRLMFFWLLFFCAVNVYQTAYAQPCDSLFEGVVFSSHPPKKSLFIPESIEGFLVVKKMEEMFSGAGYKNVLRFSKAYNEKITLRGLSVNRSLLQFREAYNRGWFGPKDIYVKYQQGLQDGQFTRPVYAKIVDFSEDALKVEALNHSGRVEEVLLSGQVLETVSVSDQAKIWFTKILQAPHVLPSFNILRTNKEEELKKIGHRPDYVEGVDAMHFMMNFVKSLREHNVNPYVTHIEDFAPLVFRSMKVIKEGILLQRGHINEKEIQKKLKELRMFDKEVRERIQSRTMTYHWWVYFNVRLAVLATSSYKRVIQYSFYIENKFKEQNSNSGDLFDPTIRWWQSYEATSKLLDHPPLEYVRYIRSAGSEEMVFLSFYLHLSKAIMQFPDMILFPVPEPLNVMAFTMGASSRIVPLGLTGMEKNADGKELTQEQYLIHDYLHYIEFEYGKREILLDNDYNPIDFEAFHKVLMERLEKLTPKEREAVEMIYYLFLREEEKPINIYEHPRIDGATFDILLNENDLGSLIPKDNLIMGIKNNQDFDVELLMTTDEEDIASSGSQIQDLKKKKDALIRNYVNESLELFYVLVDQVQKEGI